MSIQVRPPDLSLQRLSVSFKHLCYTVFHQCKEILNFTCLVLSLDKDIRGVLYACITGEFLRSTLVKYPTYLQMFLVIRASYYGKEIVERDHVFRFWVVRAGCAFTTYNGRLIINLDANLTLYGLFCCCSGNFHSSFCTVAIFRP